MKVLGTMLLLSAMVLSVGCGSNGLVSDDVTQAEINDKQDTGNDSGLDTEVGAQPAPSKPETVTLVPVNPTVSLPGSFVPDNLQATQTAQPAKPEISVAGISNAVYQPANDGNDGEKLPLPIGFGDEKESQKFRPDNSAAISLSDTDDDD